MPRKPANEGALYVRLPAIAVDKLDRAAELLGLHKKDLVAGLVTKYVDPDSRRGLDELGQLSQPRRVTVELGDNNVSVGSYSFHSYELPEVLTSAQASQLLQVPEPTVLELAESGQLPGKKLGAVWRFSRVALVQWLAEPQGHSTKPHRGDK
jgi:excisionase family DNA binding protein